MTIDLTPLWDFARPDVSEQRFRAALANATGDDALILRTPVALEAEGDAAGQASR